MNIVEKRGDIARRNKFYLLFDGKVAEGHLSDVINSTLGYALTYYHTIDGNMYKEWMNEKRTKKDFHIKNDNERRIWVYLSDRKNEEEVKPLNLMMDESDEFNEVAKKWILKGWVIILSISSLSWHTISCRHRMGNSRFSISPIIDWDTFISFTRIVSMIGWMITWNGTEMP